MQRPPLDLKLSGLDQTFRPPERGPALPAIGYLNSVPLTPLSLPDAVHWVMERAAEPGDLQIVATINLQFLRLARFDPNFAKLLRRHTAVNLVDGRPVAWLLRRITGCEVPLSPGSDLTAALLKSDIARNLGIYLVGDAPETLRAVQERALREGWVGTIFGSESPPREAVDSPIRSREIVERINSSGAKIVLVAFGAPRQEYWLRQWMPYLRARVGVGIGGSLKFVAWPRRRAPHWMRQRGFEWLHRFSLEPLRLGPRYARDTVELLRLWYSARRASV
jgi:N-acetylglucosaminyldiphosphoundecaprenol N-acetyl-beta-D-mannosaminyltransferase